MTDEQAKEAHATGPAARHDALTARQSQADGGGAAEAESASLPDAGALQAGIFARRRAEQGLSLEDVANQLKFSARQIEALETGDFERLPGGTFVRGMMRSYARLLKIEPAEITAQLTAAGAKPQSALEEAVSLRTPIPFSEGGKHVNLVYILLSVAILATVAFFAIQWYQESRNNGKLAFVRPVSVIAPDAGAPPQAAGAALSPEAATFARAGATPPAETTPPPEGKDVAQTSALAVAPATPAAEATARNASVGSGNRRIALRFEGQSWVEIKAARGAVLLSQINPAGTEKVVEGPPPFEITIGNAPRVQLFYNDKPVDLKPHINVDVARLTLN